MYDPAESGLVSLDVLRWRVGVLDISAAFSIPHFLFLQIPYRTAFIPKLLFP